MALYVNCLRLRYWRRSIVKPTPHFTNLFVRKLQRVELTTGDTIEGWAYEYNGNPDGALVIAQRTLMKPR